MILHLRGCVVNTICVKCERIYRTLAIDLEVNRNRGLSYTGLRLSQICRLVLLNSLTPKTVGLAVEISLIICLQAETSLVSLLVPVCKSQSLYSTSGKVRQHTYGSISWIQFSQILPTVHTILFTV